MPRIRSVHPGWHCDEDVVECGPWARLMEIGLWNYADDQGMFEWKPKTLKMQIFPAENHDISELLEELSRNSRIKQIEVDGKAYGLIRNFRKYQRPKSPKKVHPLPDEYRNYVGLGDTQFGTDGEAMENHFGNGTEKEIQREDGGGRRKEKGEKKGKEYKYAGRVIRLTVADYETWERAYHTLDLKSELQSLDDYYANEGVKNWFARASSALKKRHDAKLSTEVADAVSPFV